MTASTMTHVAWMTTAEEEYRRLGVLLRGLPDADWQRATDCADWDVREVVAHLVGAAEATASVREMRRQQRLGTRRFPGGDTVDAMNALQVAERAAASPAELVAALADAGRRGVRARRRLPAPVRALRVPFGPPLGVRPLGYLTDRIYTRDAWLHRVDIARATGAPLELTPEHDGRIVADVVAEWAAVHRQPFELALRGPAGGSWSRGRGEQLDVDAIEFCRILSGREPASGLLARHVPF